VLEANANPNISAGEDFAASALKAGMSYDELLHRILQLGENYPAAWRGLEA
jgi:D-alanine-D-alanine ligase